jgi:hypothetical protein
MDMKHAAVEIGQNWSIWDSGRRQWLLGTVTRRADGQATLKYDSRYRIGVGHDERTADESTMLSTRNLFRLVEGG